MASLTSPSLLGAGSLVARPSVKRRNLSLRAGQTSISVEQHFGTKALEEFEKSKLGQLDVKDLNVLSEQLRERGKDFDLLPVWRQKRLTHGLRINLNIFHFF
jgi:hypothetical protein